MEQYPEFETVLARICRGEAKLSSTELYALSGASRSEAQRFGDLWASVAVQDRRRVMQTLAESAEANFDMDFDDLFRCGLDDTDQEVRFHAIEGLWECEDTSLIEPFIALMRGDAAVEVRAAAALSLGRFALRAELGEMDAKYGRRVRESLLDTAGDNSADPEVRRRALEAVAYFDMPQVAELIALAYEGPELKTRASAVFAMGRSNDPLWTEIVLDELESPEPEMRFEAARAAGEIQIKHAVSLLIELIADADREIQEAAIWSLGQIGGSRAKQVLEGLVEGEDDVLAVAAEEALGELALGADSLVLFSFDPDEDDLAAEADAWA